MRRPPIYKRSPNGHGTVMTTSSGEDGYGGHGTVMTGTSGEDDYLAAGLNLEQIVGALTDKSKRLNFPIALPPVELSKNTKATLFITAGILALGGIATALIITRK